VAGIQHHNQEDGIKVDGNKRAKVEKEVEVAKAAEVAKVAEEVKEEEEEQVTGRIKKEDGTMKVTGKTKKEDGMSKVIGKTKKEDGMIVNRRRDHRFNFHQEKLSGVIMALTKVCHSNPS